MCLVFCAPCLPSGTLRASSPSLKCKRYAISSPVRRNWNNFTSAQGIGFRRAISTTSVMALAPLSPFASQNTTTYLVSTLRCLGPLMATVSFVRKRTSYLGSSKLTKISRLSASTNECLRSTTTRNIWSVTGVVFGFVTRQIMGVKIKEWLKPKTTISQRILT